MKKSMLMVVAIVGAMTTVDAVAGKIYFYNKSSYSVLIQPFHWGATMLYHEAVKLSNKATRIFGKVTAGSIQSRQVIGYDDLGKQAGYLIESDVARAIMYKTPSGYQYFSMEHPIQWEKLSRSDVNAGQPGLLKSAYANHSLYGENFVRGGDHDVDSVYIIDVSRMGSKQVKIAGVATKVDGKVTIERITLAQAMTKYPGSFENSAGKAVEYTPLQ